MEKRHITQPPCMTPWFMLGSFFILWFWFAFSVGRLIPEWSDNWLVEWAGFVVISLVLFCLHRFLLWGDVELTERGIKCPRRPTTMTTHPNQKDRLPTTTVIARAVRPVAIRISPAQPGPGDAKHRRGYGLPRRFAARNDIGNRNRSFSPEVRQCFFDCAAERS